MSSEQAKSYHSITIGERNTWDDWHLVPSPRPLVNPPPLKSTQLEIVGGDGVLDLTTSLTKQPTYEDRTGSWNFIVVNWGQLPSSSPFTGWTALYSEIMAYLHGRRLRVILDDEPDFYYIGRLAVSEWVSAKGNSLITINYRFEPYKINIQNPSIKRF